MQSDGVIPDRPVAEQLMQLMIERTVLSVAVRRQSQRVTGRNVITPEIPDGRIARHLQMLRGSLQCGFELHRSAPALVVSAEKLCELSELWAVPLQAELQRRLAQS